jgi:hypothetical protein
MFKTSQASDVGSIFTAPNGRSTHRENCLRRFRLTEIAAKSLDR